MNLFNNQGSTTGGRNTQNSRRAGIQDTLLSFTQHRRPQFSASPHNPFIHHFGAATPADSRSATQFVASPARYPSTFDPWTTTPLSPLPNFNFNEVAGESSSRRPDFSLNSPQPFPGAIRQPTISPSGVTGQVLDQMDQSHDNRNEEEEEGSQSEASHHSSPSRVSTSARFLEIQDRLADALAALARNTVSAPAPVVTRSDPAPKVKARAPDTFDGSDPSKLDTFVTQCMMYIALRAAEFPSEDTQVTFMLSYLKGAAFDWFQTELMHYMQNFSTVAPPIWLSSSQTFLSELTRIFGPRDPIGDAISQLENLRYRDSGRAIRYTTDFNRHARRTGWNEAALYRRYYTGLPDRLKDDLARIGKNPSLVGLQEQIQILDQRYWERQNEISRDKKIKDSSGSSKQNTSDPTKGSTQKAVPSVSGSGPSSNSGSRSDKQNKDKGKGKQNAQSSTSDKPNPIADKLGSDGKLKEEERKRRIENDLCLFCGHKGHSVRDCRKAAASKNTKGRASNTQPATPAAAAPAGKDKKSEPVKE